MKATILIVLALLILAVPAYFFITATHTAIEVTPIVKVIGFDTPMHVHLANKHGVRSLNFAV